MNIAVVRPEFVTQTDVVPELWQFINGLRPDDLVAELIQNEIDAGSTHTVISFEAARFTCSGNGEPVDDDGWKRLTFMRGAGDLAPRKRSMIGVKNHGLKACFSIGDDIFIRSAGKFAQQTLYKNGYDHPPSPGASKRALPDASAPTGKGTVIEVPYRVEAIKITTGEPVVLNACDQAVVDDLFLDAIDKIPARFIGVLTPRFNPAYTLELRHHALGKVIFSFEVTRSTSTGKMTTYQRKCSVLSDVEGVVPRPFVERVVSTVIKAPAQEVDFPDFYREDRLVRIEVSWSEKVGGKPVAENGRLRYPIAYAGSGEFTTTGVGAHYSAPFKSDTERHGLAAGSADWNDKLLAACDDLLVGAIKSFVLSKAAGRSLDLLVDPTQFVLERTRRLLESAIEQRAMPLVEGPRRRKPSGAPNYSFLIPMVAGGPPVIDKDLAAVAPVEYDQIAPGVHLEIMRLLSSRKLTGYGETHIIFDQEDALLRLSHVAGNPRFPWSSKGACEKCLNDPKSVRQHLDAIWKPIAARRAGTKTRVEARFHDETILPGADRKIYYAKDLHLGAALPDGLPVNLTPQLVHPALADHPLLGNRGWDLKKFTLDDFLERFAEDERTPETRVALFRWVERNLKNIPTKSWTTLRDLPIWPDISGVPGELGSLCKLGSSAIERVLDGFIRVPSRGLLALVGPLKRRGLSLPLRATPNTEELLAWIASSTDALSADRPLDDAEIHLLRSFEEALVTISADARIGTALGSLASRIPAINQAGYLGMTSDFVRATGPVAALSLKADYLIDRPKMAIDHLVPPMQAPSQAMVVQSLQEDAENVKALVPRLKCLADMSPDKRLDLGVSEIACIPLHGQFRRPDTLAFKSNKGNFWGSWRDDIPGVADSEQGLYRRAGVISSEPNATTSKAFFSWVAADPARVDSHLQQVVRQFGHAGGPLAWWDVEDHVPCLPVQGPDGFRLISHVEAVRRPPVHFVNDFPEIGRAIAELGFPISLVVTEIENVRASIFEPVRDAGVQSLREKVGQPKSVKGVGGSLSPAWAMDILGAYLSRKAEDELHKALVQQGIASSLIRTRWSSGLAAIKQVMRAQEVTATYRIGKQTIQARVRHAFDQSTGTLWLAEHSDQEMQDAFFDALAERVFERNAPPYCAPTLERALHFKVHQVRKPVHTDATQADDEPFDDDEDDLGETPKAHHDWKPDPTKNIPAPKPLDDLPNKASAAKKAGAAKKKQREAAPNEAEHIQNLKEKHYAWHCQMALANQSPATLAPKRSYAEYQENRKRLIDAHHPDLVEAGGARHAGNVLILSHLAHHQYGRHIARKQVTEALLAGGETKNVAFGTGKDKTTVEGVVVHLELAAIGETVSLFFTPDHRDYWIAKA